MRTPTYYVIVPTDTTPAGITYARRWFQRINRPTAGVWSIESAEHQAGYHLNVIAEWCEISQKFKGHIYRAPIHSTVRQVAAYITKPQRAATREAGFARQHGDFGNVAHWLHRAAAAAPIIAGAQMQHELAPHYLPPSPPGPERPYDNARRHLSAIYNILAQTVASSQHEPHI